jgi:tetratricopeptide (TPR) repeat protein
LWSRRSAAGDPAALERAAEEFEKAAAIDPYFAQAHFGAGYVSVRKEKWLEAAASFEAAARLNPGWAEPHYMLGVAWREAGRPDRAEKPWRRFLELDPGSPLAPAVREALRRPGDAGG